MKRIKINLRIFKNAFLKAISVLFSVMSAVLLLVPKEDFGIDTLRESFVVFCLVGVVAFIYAVIKTFSYKKVEIFNNGRCSLTVRYGDLWKFAFKKRRFKKSNGKRIVVVGVNTAFDTIVDNDLSKVAKPLVSGQSIHGQWLNLMKSKGVDESTINKVIQNNLQLQGMNCVYVLDKTQKERGNLECFERGTIAVYEYGNTIFYLLALAEFDENNNAHNSKENLIESIKDLILFLCNKINIMKSCIIKKIVLIRCKYINMNLAFAGFFLFY